MARKSLALKFIDVLPSEDSIVSISIIFQRQILELKFTWFRKLTSPFEANPFKPVKPNITGKVCSWNYFDIIVFTFSGKSASVPTTTPQAPANWFTTLSSMLLEAICL